MNIIPDQSEFESYLLTRFATISPPEDAELYLNGGISAETREELEAAGWTVVNLITQPSSSENDKVKQIKNFFHGVRVGSIISDTDTLKFIEKEAQIYGLTFSGRKDKEEQKAVNNKDIDALLNLGN